jgi:hypothetical protein
MESSEQVGDQVRSHSQGTRLEVGGNSGFASK